MSSRVHPASGRRELNLRDLREAMELVWDVFEEFEAPDYSPAGVDEFQQYIDQKAMGERLLCGELLLWGAFDEEELVGVLALRPPGHISLLFVDKKHHRQGIARGLMEDAAAHALGEGCNVLTVHASLYGEEAYRHMGFVPTGEKTTENGITYIPMEKHLEKGTE
ncbi:MAG: GNAT family N-acetyltransferase [Oscillospiraceae bacterium]